MDLDTLRAIKDVSDKINRVQLKLDSFMQSQLEITNANIEYLAMMAAIDLEEEDQVEQPIQEE